MQQHLHLLAALLHIAQVVDDKHGVLVETGESFAKTQCVLSASRTPITLPKGINRIVIRVFGIWSINVDYVQIQRSGRIRINSQVTDLNNFNATIR